MSAVSSHAGMSMPPPAWAAGLSPRLAHRLRWRNALVECVLLLAIGYNFLLAVVNAKVFTVRPAMTYVVEFALYGACFVLGLWSLDRRRAALVVGGLAFIVLLNLLRFFLVWEFDPKFLRDALIPFAFLVLGCAYRGSVPRLLVRMTLVIALVAAFELAMPTTYGDVVNPKSYFVNARGFSASGFWNEDSNLFVSATRPGARNFLPSSNLPRASSVFIEPVTMGNYIIFFMAVLLAFRRWLSGWKQVLGFGLTAFLIVASDGRLAAGTCVLMLLAAPILRRLDQRLAFALFAAVLLGGWALVGAAGVHAYEDTMLGRIFFTVDSMSHLSLPAWLGLDTDAAYRYFDSGIAYFVVSQSIFAVLVFLLAYSFLMILPGREGQVFKHLAILAFALSLLVSNGYFSIKTAALWWFVCGWLWQGAPVLPSARQLWRQRASIAAGLPP